MMTPERPVKTYAIPSPLLQDIVTYLQTKPWHEVNPFIAGLMQIVQGDQQNAQQNINVPGEQPNMNGRDRVPKQAEAR